MKLSWLLVGLVLFCALSLGGVSALVQRRSNELSAELPTLLQEQFREVNESSAIDLSKVHGDAGRKLRSTAQSIDKLQESILGLARSGLDNTTKIFIDEIRVLVQDSMIPSLINESDIVEQGLRDLLAGFDALKASVDASLSAESVPNFTAHSSAHKACRQNQSSLAAGLPGKQSAWKAAHTTKESACGAYDFANAIPIHDQCGAPSHGEPMRDYVVGLRALFKQKHQQLHELKANCEWATAIEADKRKQLEDLQAQVDERDEICDVEQQNMDKVACNYVEEVRAVCSFYDIRYNDKRTAYLAEYSNAQAIEAGLQAEYRALKRIECIILEWLADNLDPGLDDCKNTTHSTEPVDINWTGLEVPEKDYCGQPEGTMRIYSPASHEYNRSEYAVLPANAPAEACSALPCCVEPVIGTTTLLPATSASAGGASLLASTRERSRRRGRAQDTSARELRRGPTSNASLVQLDAGPVPSGTSAVPTGSSHGPSDAFPALSEAMPAPSGQIPVPSGAFSSPGGVIPAPTGAGPVSRGADVA